MVFYSQLAKEEKRFTFNDIAVNVSRKMIERHPHVFGNVDMRDAEEQTVAWEAQKARERAAKSQSGTEVSALDGVARTLPAMVRAQKLQKRAARVGFDWPEASDIFEKIEEETLELKEAITADDAASIKEELGDLMFVMVNLCRKLGVDAEDALKSANSKFESRFHMMEQIASDNKQIFADLQLDDQENLWQQAKRKLRT